MNNMTSSGKSSCDEVVGVANNDRSVTSVDGPDKLPGRRKCGFGRCDNRERQRGVSVQVSLASALYGNSPTLTLQQGEPEAKEPSRTEDQAADSHNVLPHKDSTIAGEAHSEAHRSPPPPTAANGLRYDVVSTVSSRRHSVDREYFDECLGILEQNMPPLPTDIPVTADPRDYEHEREWRDAVREELGLATKWWTAHGKGFILKLSTLRLRAAKNLLFCFSRSTHHYNCHLRTTLDFLEANLNCDSEYCIDFFTKEDIEDDDVNNFETGEFSIKR
ncbi:hypothetical protein CBER1_08965 [Cercospora berteroae]|uniref:Uncharacterized protein n=1 Tax=Cercospora berteroae TaxID=357750 RepID=A0A2S6C5G3_9PEZI|nr:hypothetical protein CBER1_08965 [Cercospora berteroae]